MKKLFISYAHTDKWQVKQLVDILKQGNYDAWFDHRLVVGGDWQAQLLDAIKTCDAFVYALSPESVESEWCRWEFAEAVKLGKPVIPVLIQGKTNIPPSITSRQYADFTEGPSVEGTARLIAGIHNAITIPPAEVSAPTKPTGKPAQIIRNGSVFISYSTKDDSYAYALEDHLKQQGFDVWIDKKGLRVQDSWTDTIENAVEDCAAFIVLMSEASKDSKWVRRELLHAQDCDKPIFPLQYLRQFGKQR
jgi:hypothetical protein